MYGKLKNLSIEELEVEIEDLDIVITRFAKEQESIKRQIGYLEEQNEIIEKGIIKLRAHSKVISDLILEKQKEETH